MNDDILKADVSFACLKKQLDMQGKILTELEWITFLCSHLG